MELTVKQEEGLKTALARYRAGEKYTVISGYAGTGKSTLIKFIIAAMNIDPNEVRYVAYTGKAANVLKNKGCPGATTAHKLLYHAKRLPNGKYKFSPKTKQELEEEGIKVVVIDEVSMLPKDMWDLICSNNFYILACGDPCQLPPIVKETDNHVLDNPHVFLDEIMRQARESEIIRLSMHIREDKPLASFSCSNEEVMLVKKKDLSDSMLMWADQILCATNRTKTMINNKVRKILNFPEIPQVGDKIINLNNEWDIVSNKGNPLTNGVIGLIQEGLKPFIYEYSTYIKTGKNYNGPSMKVPVLQLAISGDEEGETFQSLEVDYKELTTGFPSLTGEQEYRLFKSQEAPPLHFNYGYAITCWKAQGSEWNKILFYTENWPYDKELRRQFLYTGCTRSQERLVVII